MKNIAFSIGASITTKKAKGRITPTDWRQAILTRLAVMHPSEYDQIETWDTMDTEDGNTQADIDAATNRLPPFNPEANGRRCAIPNGKRAARGARIMGEALSGSPSGHTTSVVIMDLLLHRHQAGDDPIKVLGDALSMFAERTMSGEGVRETKGDAS